MDCSYIANFVTCFQHNISHCQAWKNAYDNISQVHNKFSQEGWMLDETSIFAQVDAFIHRCRDLLEVVEGQMDFARYSEGKKKPVPCFGGCRGPEVTRSYYYCKQELVGTVRCSCFR